MINNFLVALETAYIDILVEGEGELNVIKVEEVKRKIINNAYEQA